MATPFAASDKTAVKSGRRPPLIVGLVMIVVILGGYLGWQHFAHSPGATTPELPPPVPVIAATVQQRDFPIVLTGDWQRDGAEQRDGPQPGHGADPQHRLQGRPVCQKRPAPGSARSEHLSGAARPGGGQSRPRRSPSRKWADQSRPVHPAAKTRLCAGATGRHAASDDRPGRGHDQSRSGGDRICPDRS